MKDLSKKNLKSQWEELGRLERQLAELANTEKKQEDVYSALTHDDSGLKSSLNLEASQSFYQN